MTKRVVLVGSFLLVACGGTNASGTTASPAEPLSVPSMTATTATSAATPPSEPPPPAQPEPDYEGRLANARKLRDSFMALKTPKLANASTKEEALKFVQTKVKTWYEEARPKVDAADTAYAAALKSARNPMERATVFGEAADLQTMFVERFVDAGTAGMPAEWKKQPDIAEVFESSIRQATAPWVTRARDILTRCAAAMPADATCAAVDKRVSALEAVTPKSP